ncbi:orotidine-5'-phosphate decarboxylase [Hirschia maritima]|uniref:orotidine-5'-phosphate decarboxylase n=1 Tax=Hirschia maritima TaxID=1121961 RepID=UPI0003AABE5B|nr:orotidine-5'-phosphate decarboxylase [Hirschia maritima]
MNSPIPFADRLMKATLQLGPLCVGVDPHWGRIPSMFGPDNSSEAVKNWGKAIIARCEGKVAMVKPQAGLFERWGSKGVAALESVCQSAQDANLLVMMDAKRGDIGSTAVGYAEAYLGAQAYAPSDAITVNPYMGLDTLEPFVEVAQREGKGIAVLARTSNPGSSDFQAKDLEGVPLFMRVAESLNPLAERLQGNNTQWSGLMLVAGATGPEEAKKLRKAAPICPFLVPGYGAQGAGASEAVAGFVNSPNGLVGGLVNASRSITFPEATQNASTAKEWDQAVDEAIKAAQTDLLSAVHKEV